MKLAICGATGGTGRQLVEQALARGHEVTAIVRDPSKLDMAHPQLQIVQADMLDIGSFTRAITSDHKAVISALGLFNKQPSTELSEGTKNLIAAMQSANIQRFLCISSWGASGTDKQAPFVMRLFAFKYLFRHTLADKNRQEAIIRDSGLNYTILRPAGLRDREPLGETYTWTGADPDARPKHAKRLQVSRSYLAHYCLECLEDPSTIGREINLSE